jgi:uncharacterized cupin superfamily protein
MTQSSFQLLGSTIRLLHVKPGAFSVLEFRTPPQASAPPPHLHRQTDEAVYVASGRLATDVDGEQTTHEQGSFALIRHGQKHTFWNPGEDTATYLVVLTPPDWTATSPSSRRASRRGSRPTRPTRCAGTWSLATTSRWLSSDLHASHAVPRGENQPEPDRGAG